MRGAEGSRGEQRGAEGRTWSGEREAEKDYEGRKWGLALGGEGGKH